jgi:DNA primase
MSLKSLLDRAFGEEGTELRNGEVAYHCPFCHHAKKKLQVNLLTHNWKCWICKDTHQTVGKAIKTLFKKMNVLHRFQNELKQHKINTYDFSGETEDAPIALPDEFQSLTKKSWMPEYKHALRYLTRRKISPLDIIKYNIGFCGSGQYKNRIIIPSYDHSGALNYFVSRTWIKDHPLKYMNPPVSKEIIGLELLINWNMPVVLTEGVFDCIAIRRNAIPLFGKSINEALKMKLVENNVKDLYLILDEDALENAIRSAEELCSYGINVYAVELGDKDPSDLGYIGIHEIMKNTEPFNFNQLINMKLSL